MAEHRSLDEFATDAADEEEDEVPEPTELDALVRTYRWSPDGETCTSCGTEAQTFWTHEGRMVCPACKEW